MFDAEIQGFSWFNHHFWLGQDGVATPCQVPEKILRIFVCHTPERFYAVATVLAKMVEVAVARGSLHDGCSGDMASHG